MADQLEIARLKSTKNEKDHRIYEIVQKVKDLTTKKKYNEAWEHTVKFYDQNKSSLNNYQIFQLILHACNTIRKKLHSRLAGESTMPIVETNMLQFYELYTNLYNFALPDIVKWDQPYFLMLQHSDQPISAQFLSSNNLLFQRKIEGSFTGKQQKEKELKKVVKKFLMLCKLTLMYHALGSTNLQALVTDLKQIQEIFKGYKEIDFPSTIMKFQLAKLSIMEDMGIKETWWCEYRLPVGYLNRIYKHLKTATVDELNHYTKQLTSYVVLCLKHLTIPIEDVYVLCNEMLYLIQAIEDRFAPSQEERIQKQKPSLAKQYSMEREDMCQSISFMKIEKKGTKLTEKRAQMKRYFGKEPHHILKSLVSMALSKIDNYIASRKEIKHIILSYYSEDLIKDHKTGPNEQIIQSEVALQNQRKSKKRTQTEKGDAPTNKTANKSQTLQSLFKKRRMDKRNSVQESSEAENLMMKVSSKNKGKFILKNIQTVHRSANSQINYTKQFDDSLNLDKISIIEESSSDSDGEAAHQFERIRRERIREMNTRKRADNSMKQMELDIYDHEQTASKGNKGQPQKINYVDEIVTSTISQMLGIRSGQDRHHDKKDFENLKQASKTLNLERQLLVDQLLMSKNRFNQLQAVQPKQQIPKLDKKQQIQDFNRTYDNLIRKHIEENRKFSLSHKAGPSKNQPPFMNKSNQSKMKLKLETSKNKMAEITFPSLQEQYRAIEGTADKKQQWDMCLGSQFDKLRRDVAKNQFAVQNEKTKKMSPTKDNCKTILEMIDEEQTA